MSGDSPSDRKRVRLDEEAEEVDDVVPLEQDENQGQENEAGPSDEVLHAARLAKVIQHRPKVGLQTLKFALAWSATNIIAITRSKKITLVHLLAPSRACHIQTPEKASILTFSPDGNALLATFPESATVSLWTCSSNVLNDWTLRGEWRQLEGKVLDVKWLNAGRPRTPSNLSKKSSRGPQMNDKNVIVAILVTDVGLVKIIQGNLRPSSDLRTFQHKITLNSHHRLQQISIGLVPDESLAILAYTLRYSSKANLPHASGAGDALDMFFDDTEGSDPSSGNAAPSDGQDQIELMEVKIDLHPTDDSLALQSRSLPPVFTATFDGPSMPSTTYLNQLAWVDIESTGKDEGPIMQLFASFFTDCKTTLRTWKIRREETTRLSEAFAKLESAKTTSTSSDEEEWTVQDSVDLVVENEQLSDFTSSASMENRLVCTSVASSRFEKIEDTPKVEPKYEVLNMETMKRRSIEGDDGLRTKCRDSLYRPAVSPHATMIAGIGRGRIVLASVTGLLDEAADDVSLYSAAILDGQDLSDISSSRALPPIAQIASRLKLGQNPSFPHALMLLSLQARREKGNDVSRHTERTMLELSSAFRVVAASDATDGSFQLSKVWAIVGQLNWVISTLEMTARQAHLLDVKLNESSPESTDAAEQENDDKEFEYMAEEEPDMLSLLTLAIPRQLFVKTIVKLVSFYNWMDGTIAGNKVDSKAAFKALAIQAQRQAQPAGELIASGAAERTSEMMQLAHTKMREMILQSGVDVSQFGRFLRSYDSDTNENSQKDRQQQWYTMPTAPMEDRKRFARALLSSESIQNMLDLFCPSSDWTIPPLGDESLDIFKSENVSTNVDFSESRMVNHDILTRMKSLSSTRRKICLSCQGQTQADVSRGIRCVCGAHSWWSSI
ncbi:uncharacterized protein FA14DRAFT_181579 [Meira miltonrushii]|uniref:Uncharacterized protein n=1 Tax=Meira miltonrushii TaxID=1280837 RepID=A0A316VBF3_9BASI|nr:uncharacterized protein FA14DRAFT_181579 [Meira miltonrushii]PWN32905.1 hypothetical protein FA14DRAFT_181579 [Meira miltonrushii]